MSLHSEDWVWGPAAAEEDRRHRIVAGRAVAGRTKCHRVPSLMWTYFAALREGTEMWEVCTHAGSNNSLIVLSPRVYQNL